MILERLFGTDSNKNDIKTEVTAGATTFITICYILAVIPSVLATTGIPQSGAFTVTALITAITTLCAAVTAKQPYVLGPSLGLNAFFAFTLVHSAGYTGRQALTLLFVEGILFFILVLANVHKYILNSIPDSLRNALVAGIGMFISFIGLKNSGIIVSNPGTLVQLGEMTPQVILGLISIVLSGILVARGIKGALFYSIVICTLAGIPMGVTVIDKGFVPFSFPDAASPIGLDFGTFTANPADALIVIFTLLIINIFDALGGMLGVSSYTGDKGASEKCHVKKAFIACSAGTAIGSIFGMSPISIMAESSSGAASGGRTGLSAAVTGLLFIVALFLSPIFMLIPMSAITGCLVIVGVYMISSITNINFRDMSEAMPAYITILMTVLTFSIADGICFGVIAYVLTKIFTCNYKSVSLTMFVLAILFIIKELIG